MKNLFTKAPAVFTGAAALLAGGLLAVPASAQGEAESMMTLGGSSNYTVSFTKHPGGSKTEQEGDIQIYNNTEIFFNGSGETDGGLQVSARVELEGHSENDQIDEHYITVSGGFGSLEVGANDSADERLAKGVYYNSTAVDYWYTNAEVVPGGSGGAGYRNIGQGDGMGIVYTTPSLGGATFAIGYKPSAEGDGKPAHLTSNSRGAETSGDEDYISFGAKYDGDMDGVTLGASFGYHQHDNEIKGPFAGRPTLNEAVEPAVIVDAAVIPKTTEVENTTWSVGVNVGFGDTTLYARHQDQEADPKDGEASEYEISSLAVSHSVGPATLGLGWVQGTATSAADVETEDTMVLGSVDYTLGAGVTLAGYAAWGESEVKNDTDNKESGTALGVALNLAF